MSMPRGASIGSYVTLADRESMQFRLIADKMTATGSKMSHATARSIVINVMQRLARDVLIALTGVASDDDVKRLAMTEEFQLYIGEVLDTYASGARS